MNDADIIINAGTRYAFQIKAVIPMDMDKEFIDKRNRINEKHAQLQELINSRGDYYLMREKAATISGDYLKSLKIEGMNNNPELVRKLIIGGIEQEMEKIRLEFENLKKADL